MALDLTKVSITRGSDRPLEERGLMFFLYMVNAALDDGASQPIAMARGMLGDALARGEARGTAARMRIAQLMLIKPRISARSGDNRVHQLIDGKVSKLEQEVIAADIVVAEAQAAIGASMLYREEAFE